MRDDGEPEAILVDIIDSQGYTIYGDRAFGDDMGYLFWVYLYDKVCAVLSFGDL